MPWKVTNVMEERIAFVERVSHSQESFSAVCRAFEISRPTGYRWWQRYRAAASTLALFDRSRRPQRSPTQTPKPLEQRVVRLRERYGWGARKLQVLLADEGFTLPVITINRILKRCGLVSRRSSARPAVRRFQRSAPNQLWQIDFKGEIASADGWCFPLSMLDDHSRFVVGLYALRGTRARPVQQRLITTFERYGIPDGILFDHGPPWWSTTNGHGLTWLSVWLVQQGIDLHYSGIGHPQTQGKVERFHRTLDQAARRDGYPDRFAAWQPWLTGFRIEYNEIRPHEETGMRPPVSRYQPSPRPYNPHPPEWEYPTGALVRRLNTQGCLDWKGRRLFVCEALANQRVQLEPLHHLLLVRYRHLYVREIDLARGCSRAIVKSKKNVQNV